MNDVGEKLKNARRQLEDIRTKRMQAQDALRQLDLNEAAWMGFIEALSPYAPSEDEEPVVSQDVPEGEE
jgi:hypothetical protein